MNSLSIPVEEFTTPDPVVLTEKASVDDLMQVMKNKGIRHIPIVSDGKVVGVVSDRDVRVVMGLNFQEKNLVQARDIMTSNPFTVSSETPLEEVALEMSRQKIGSVIVTEGNQLLGIFTVTDALNALIEISRGRQN